MAINSPIFDRVMKNSKSEGQSALASTAHLRNIQQPQELSQVSTESSASYPGMGDLNTLPGTPSPTVVPTDNNVSIPRAGKRNRNIENNSPGNIKDFGIEWEGMNGTDSGGKAASGNFVRFKSPEYGARALHRDLSSKMSRGVNTISKILNIYAPNGKENDTSAYINSVAKQTGIGKDTNLSKENLFSIMKAITVHEGDNEGYFTDDILRRGIQMSGK